MDGTTLLAKLRGRLNESVDDLFMDDKSSYEYLNEGAQDLVERTQCLRGTVEIPTVSGQAAYDLPADYLNLLLSRCGLKFVQYTHNGNVTILSFKELGDVVYENNTTSVAVPSHFTLADNQELPDRIIGEASVTEAASYGECLLSGPTVTAGDLDNVSVGDVVHNITDGSSGYVVAVSGTDLTCCLFDGNANAWAEGDAFIIQPCGRMQLVLAEPPSDDGDTITVQYVKKPAPVFSPYASFRFNDSYCAAIIFYAAWLYKFRDREPRFADAFYREYERKLGINGENVQASRNAQKVSFSLKGRK